MKASFYCPLSSPPPTPLPTPSPQILAAVAEESIHPPRVPIDLPSSQLNSPMLACQCLESSKWLAQQAPATLPCFSWPGFQAVTTALACAAGTQASPPSPSLPPSLPTARRWKSLEISMATTLCGVCGRAGISRAARWRKKFWRQRQTGWREMLRSCQQIADCRRGPWCWRTTSRTSLVLQGLTVRLTRELASFGWPLTTGLVSERQIDT